MSEPLIGVVVAHGSVAEALVDAVRRIAGIDDALIPVSNDDCDTDALAGRITAARGGRPGVLFVDMAGGSCTTTAARLLREMSDTALVTGVNLPMLIDFVFHRDLSPPDAAQRAVDAATQSIRRAAP